MASKFFVMVHPADNVITMTKEMTANTVVEVDSDKITVLQDVPFGHKLATKKIEKGSGIIKYGVKIGVASATIRKGEHVHIHNVDEISFRIRDEAKRKSLGSA